MIGSIKKEYFYFQSLLFSLCGGLNHSELFIFIVYIWKHGIANLSQSPRLSFNILPSVSILFSCLDEILQGFICGLFFLARLSSITLKQICTFVRAVELGLYVYSTFKIMSFALFYFIFLSAVSLLFSQRRDHMNENSSIKHQYFT